MTEKNIKPRLDHSRRAALTSLYQVFSRLGGSDHGRIHLGFLYRDMQSALHCAVECWMGESAGLGWQDQEARFLRIAPDELRERYLDVAGRTTRLMTELQEQLGDDDVEQVDITAPSLADWRERALRWHSEAAELVGDVTGCTRNVKRIERGALRGAPNSLTPCFLLARGGARDGRWHRAGVQAGIFHFGERYFDSRSSRPHVWLHHGIVLPLSLCCNAPLREKLMEFAQLVVHPMSDDSALGKLVTASQRRTDLQAWLNQRDLGCLRLLDRGPVGSWIRLELASETFRKVLSYCEYVTAVSDKADTSTRILEHAPFKFESHGELLEWVDLDTRSHHAIQPFALYLANDLSRVPDMFSGTRQRKTTFRPSEYAMRFSIPDGAAISADVGIHFEVDDFGWVILRMTLGEQDIEVDFSHVYDPFPSLLEWLQAILVGDLPIGFEIDEEGTERLLIAHAFDNGRLLFAVLDKWDRTEFGAAIVDREALLAAFHKELNDFLRDPGRFNTDDWEATDILGRESYWADLLGHSFLSIQSEAWKSR